MCPAAVLRTRASQTVARNLLHKPAMRQSVDIMFDHPGSVPCWAQTTSTRSPLRMENLHDPPVVAATPVSMSALRAMMDVFNPSHPRQVTLVSVSGLAYIVAAARLHDAQA